MISAFPFDDVSRSDTSDVAAFSVYSILARGIAFSGIDGIEIRIFRPCVERKQYVQQQGREGGKGRIARQS
jgi:hypothetical protein